MNRQRFEYHPIFGYRFIPGLKARVDHEGGGYLMKVNELGFRSDREFAPDKPAGTFRVLVFGDSYTAGDGVSNKRRYSDVLESLVPGLEAYNFGLSGSGTDQQLLVHREYAHAIEHDLVVVGVFLENIYRVEARFRPYGTGDGGSEVRAKPYFILGPKGDLELGHVPVPREPLDAASMDDSEQDHLYRLGRFGWARRAVAKLVPGLKDVAQRLSRYQPLPAYNDPTHPAWRLMKAILRQWGEESRVPVVVCPIPPYQYIEETADYEGYQARFAELEGDPNLVIHDPLPDFHAAPPEERRSYRFETDAHMSAAGHRVLAQSLARRIASIRASQGG